MNKNNESLISKNDNETLFNFVDINSSKKIVSLTGSPKKAWKDIIVRFSKNWLALGSLFIILFIVAMSIFAPIASPYSAIDPASGVSIDVIKNMPPSYAPNVTEIVSQDWINSYNKLSPIDIVGETLGNDQFIVTYDKYHYYSMIVSTASSSVEGVPKTLNTILGTNLSGIDIWTRTWVASRDSFSLALLVTITESIIGITIGAILGFYAGTWIDTIFTRIVDIIRNIPQLIWFLLIITLLPEINMFFIFLTLISIGWVIPVYQTRLWMITVKDHEYILAAKSIGASKKRQIFLHALPAIIGKLSTNIVRRIVVVILSLSSLTFLGFLPITGSPNFGTLLQEARAQFGINFWILLLPSMILLMFSLSSQFVANGLHDALDPQINKGAK